MAEGKRGGVSTSTSSTSASTSIGDGLLRFLPLPPFLTLGGGVGLMKNEASEPFGSSFALPWALLPLVVAASCDLLPDATGCDGGCDVDAMGCDGCDGAIDGDGVASTRTSVGDAWRRADNASSTDGPVASNVGIGGGESTSIAGDGVGVADDVLRRGLGAAPLVKYEVSCFCLPENSS